MGWSSVVWNWLMKNSFKSEEIEQDQWWWRYYWSWKTATVSKTHHDEDNVSVSSAVKYYTQTSDVEVIAYFTEIDDEKDMN